MDTQRCTRCLGTETIVKHPPEGGSKKIDCPRCMGTGREILTDGGTDELEEQQFEWEFFVYEDEDEDDPRYSLWLQHDEEGVCLYDRPPEGHGMWLSPDRETDHDPVKPSEHLKQLLGKLVAQKDVDSAEVQQLDGHERHFFQVVHGTASENPDGLPDPVWTWMWECRDDQLVTDGGSSESQTLRCDLCGLEDDAGTVRRHISEKHITGSWTAVN